MLKQWVKIIVCCVFGVSSLYGQQIDFAKLDSIAEYYLNDSTIHSIRLSEVELEKAITERRAVYQFKALHRMATGYLINDDYDRALELSLDALVVAKKINTPQNLATTYTTLGWLYYDVKDAEQALANHQLALQFWKQTEDTLHTSIAYNAVGLSLALAGKFSEALPYYQASLSLGRKINNAERMMASMSNIGDAQHALGNEEEALSWLEQAHPLSKKLLDVLREAELYNSKAAVLIALKRYSEAGVALRISRSLIQHSKSNARKEVLMQNALVSSLYYKTLKQNDSALLSLETYNAIRNQILSDEKKASLNERKIMWETAAKENEILRLKEERELRLNQRNAIAVGIIILSVIGFFAYSRERQIRIKEKQLAETKEALAAVELLKASAETEMLNNKLEFKNKELTNYALHISQRNDLQRAFLEELEQLKPKATPELTSQLNKVMKQFSGQEEINKDAEEFHLNVEQENKDFFYNLSQRFPDLTENEKRLCAQVRLNLSIKDIASINSISVKSVEMARYRLRKKLQLDHDDSLTEFLKKF